MNFGIGKCDVLAMKRGKEVKCNWTELENGEKIATIGEKGCKYLGILEEGYICQEEMKENIRKEYWKKLRAILKSKLNANYVF